MSKLEQLIQELCPNGVEYRIISEVCEISRGSVISKQYINDNIGEFPVYSSQTENNGELGKINTYEYEGEYLTWTTDGANAGTVFYRTGKFNVTNVCGLLKIISSDNLARFVYHALSVEAPKHVRSGMGNPKLMSNVMGTISIPLPPSEIQREIVRILDNFTELTAELTAELKARKQQYEYYRDSLLTFGDDVEWKLLGSTCHMKSGKAIKAIFINDEQSKENNYECYGGNGVRGYVADYSHSGEFPIIGRQGALCGNVNYAIGEFYATEHAVVVSGKEEYLQKYLFYMLKAMDLNQYKSKGAQPGLAVGNIENLLAPVPPLEEQQRIVDILDRFDIMCNDISQGLPAEIEARNKQYEYYRDKLLDFPKLEQDA